ncbi:hypothetical protein AC622_09130 [Bacillus sp. FJAT-27916]|uniref:LysR family transcriptional regulator n=1 Tax=Bacillaceae TaxID=186817 RepID=UPI00067138AB|nr:LysR family transcriptional regulator [Bacillus sp. FJAT-27916]KMY44390.1 hypothetical protein AC622_09130 [Bacillus sp. FJAT-27916]
MSIQKYAIFREVVDTGSFSLAGERLGISQSAVSHSVTSLEKEYKVKLLARSRSGIQLTDSGQRILQYIEKILYLEEKMNQELAEIRGLELGTLTIGTVTPLTSEWLPGIMKRFHEQFPSIQVNIREGTSQEIVDWVENGEVDIGFTYSLKERGRIDRLLLTHEPFYLLMHEEKQGDDLFRLMKESPFIMPTSYREMILKQKAFKPTVLLELSDERAIIELVRNGLGISILPRMCLHNLPEEVNIMLIPHELIQLPVHLVSLLFSAMSPAAEKMSATISLWLNENYNIIMSTEEKLSFD